MPVDSNIALGVQQFQAPNPLDSMTKIAQIKNLSSEGQLRGLQLDAAQRAANDEKAMRDAYQSNVTTGPDGTPTINKAGVMSDLIKKNPVEGMKFQAEQRQVDLDALTKQTSIAKQLAWSINSPESYEQARQTGIKLGLPNADKLPPEYDPAYVKQMQLGTLTAEEQLKKQKDEHDYYLRLLHEKTYQKDVAAKRDQISASKQGTAMQQTIQMLESARGNPAVAQAEKDNVAATKFDSLFNLYGDPNKLNPAQIQLGATEVAKMASGGVPSIHELQGLNPTSIPKRLAELAQYVSNDPQSAQAGEFMKAMKDYSDALKKDARDVIMDKYGRVIEAQRSRIGETNYQTLAKTHLDRFKASAPKKPLTPGDVDNMHDNDVDALYEQLGGKK